MSSVDEIQFVVSCEILAGFLSEFYLLQRRENVAHLSRKFATAKIVKLILYLNRSISRNLISPKHHKPILPRRKFSGNCLCESSGSNFAKAKVLYCYGEVIKEILMLSFHYGNLSQVVLQRALPGTEEKEEESLWFLDIDLLQILQLVVVVLFILAM